MPGTHSAEDSLNVSRTHDSYMHVAHITPPQFAIEGTLNLARQAAKAGIKKFVAVSSINTVVGQVPRSDGGGLFTAKGAFINYLYTMSAHLTATCRLEHQRHTRRCSEAGCPSVCDLCGGEDTHREGSLGIWRRTPRH